VGKPRKRVIFGRKGRARNEKGIKKNRRGELNTCERTPFWKAWTETEKERGVKRERVSSKEIGK